MEWIKTDSSNVEAICFDEPHIMVQFKGGKIYSYSPCNAKEFSLLKNAPSKGAWVYRHLRGRKKYKLLTTRV